MFVVICGLTSPASAQWKEKVLYSFQGKMTEAVPVGGIVRDNAGNLYGATSGGGAVPSCNGPEQCGVVYRAARRQPKPEERGPRPFCTSSKAMHLQRRSRLKAASIMDGAGNLYSTTGYGGSGPCLLLGGAVGWRNGV